MASYSGSVTWVYTITVSRLRWWPGKPPTRSHAVVMGSTISANCACALKKCEEQVTKSSERNASMAVTVEGVFCTRAAPSSDRYLMSASLISCALNVSEYAKPVLLNDLSRMLCHSSGAVMLSVTGFSTAGRPASPNAASAGPCDPANVL